MRLRNQVALVTGAGRGIGEAIAVAFARECARVAVADIDPKTAAATARRIGRGRTLALTMDVADSASVNEGFQRHRPRVGADRHRRHQRGHRAHRAVPRAERGDLGPRDQGTFLVAQAAARRMAKRRRGVVITLSSVNAKSRFDAVFGYRKLEN